MGRVKKEIKSTECGDYLRQKLEHQHYLNTASTRFNMRGGSSKSEINLGKKRKIIDFKLNQITKFKKKIFILSNTKFKNLKKYVFLRYKNIDIELIEDNKRLGTAGSLESLNSKKFHYSFVRVE